MYEGMVTTISQIESLRQAYPSFAAQRMFAGYAVRKLNRFIRTQEVFIMPKGKQNTTQERSGYDVKFVNFKLAGKDKEDFSEHYSKDAAIHWKQIAEQMSKGVKFSFSENRDTGVCVASATMRNPSNVNDGLCITSRSPDWWEALVMTAFKIDLLGIAVAWSDAAGSDDWG